MLPTLTQHWHNTDRSKYTLNPVRRPAWDCVTVSAIIRRRFNYIHFMTHQRRRTQRPKKARRVSPSVGIDATWRDPEPRGQVESLGPTSGNSSGFHFTGVLSSSVRPPRSARTSRERAQLQPKQTLPGIMSSETTWCLKSIHSRLLVFISDEKWSDACCSWMFS